MKHLKHIAFSQRSVIYTLVLISLLMGAAIIAQAYYFVAVIEGVFLNNAAFQSVIPLLIGLFFVLVVRAALTYLSGRTGVKLAAKAKNEFRKSLVNKFSQNPVQASMQGQSGRKISVLMDATDDVDSYFSSYVPQMIQTAIVPIIILVAVFTQHIYSGLIMLITAPFIPFFMALIGVMTKKKSEEQLEKLAAFSGRFLDTLQGLTTLKLFGRARKQRELIEESSLGFRDATMEVLKVAFVSSLMLEFISMLSIGLIAMEIAIRLVVYENISFFSAFFILILAPEFYQLLKDAGSAFHSGRGSIVAAQKVTEELEEPTPHVEWGSSQLITGTAPPAIELAGVSFSYHDEGFALKPIDAQIAPYHQVAIVGRTGSGKTTLLHVIAGLMAPTEGQVRVNEQPLFEYEEQEWFNQLSYISQHPYLFSGTIADNIAVGSSGASREQIVKAAEKAGIASFIESLEQGFDTPVGEAGRGLSGGEKQRVAIARAFLKRPSVILFDEPTTGLDLQTEKILQRSLEELSQSSTVITVAHRLHTIQAADQILLLDEGRLIGSGTHEDLLQTVPYYRNMVSVQQGGEAR
ncbi:thiol reductant ABC exporter subunit CydD [Halobacillus andaensis]|uniref:Thiol reductant ABC exporter subunit CydD n=1 Tax=Halobacillus andaensis TaxID=1176239 RepID=A0A917BAK8_HALAA|nr:thiol reductant ABC exporter subunit CydD [Halobacillus andaensis]MBP2006372.1 ATP-binding cassette subfamily C protein CydD [Halobacillus andaensis]GGF34644.1 thiol reductant ABC exporter subunit CydD [Halobacillus andaensis]